MLFLGGFSLKLVLPGQPFTKKNSQRIIVNRRTGKPLILPSKRYREYADAACRHLKAQYRGPAFEGPVEVCAVYYLASRSRWPDLVGLLQATGDILEEAGVITNDRNIVSWDGSRIAGVSENPRAEIEIREVSDEKRQCISGLAG
jgi:Holliday junction resolvase RusA-like endonuclease